MLGLTSNPPEEIAKARKAADKALSIDERNAGSLSLAAILDLWAMKYDAAIAQADRAASLAPSNSGVIANTGFIKTASGQPP